MLSISLIKESFKFFPILLFLHIEKLFAINVNIVKTVLSKFSQIYSDILPRVLHANNLCIALHPTAPFPS